MQASKISFFNETREKLNNPILDWKKKRELKIARVIEYIESKPTGTRFKLSDLGEAAGYRITEMKDRQAGYAFIKQLGNGGVLNIEKTGKWKKLVTVPDNRHQPIPNVAHVSDLPDSTAPQPGDSLEVLGDAEDMEISRDIAFIIRIEKAARQFSWKENSDSLREFVKSLK